MIQITEEKKVLAEAEKSGVLHYFETPGIRYSIFQFQKGEYLASPDLRSEYLQFVTKGKLNIFHISEDGYMYSLAQTEGIFLLGDLQFVYDEYQPSFYAQALTKAESIAVSLKDYRDILKNDRRLLYMLVEVLARKLVLLSSSEAGSQTLEERVLNYIRFSCPDACLKGVEQAAFHLHCSSRHLQRILSAMEKEGTLKKTGKGCYILRGVDKPHVSPTSPQASFPL